MYMKIVALHISNYALALSSRNTYEDKIKWKQIIGMVT